MSKLTAMQELILLLKKYNVFDDLSLEEEFLQKEKQQIIEAAKHGANFENSPFKNSEDYYNQTFKNNENEK